MLKYDKNSILKMHDMSFKNVVIEDKSLEELLKLELEEELLADVEVGVLLSGGIDSSLITAISSKLHKNIKTFSVSFENKKLYDESKYSQLVAKSFNTDHYEFLFSEEELLNYLPQLIESTDLPIYDPAMLPMLYLMDNVSDICKVVISGDGGDEIFGGYTHHRVLKYKRTFTIINKIFSIFNIFNNKNNTLKSLLKLSPSLIDSIEYNQKVSLNHRLLRKTDLCSMRNGVEVRVPFLSNRIYKYSKKFNPKKFINIMYGKLPLRKLVKKLINSEIAFKKKQGFRVPIKEWVSEGELGKIIEQDLKNELYIDCKVISMNSIQKFLNNKEKFYDELFSLYILNNWLKKIHRLK
jgi:asparagine synthase (glutamine-hydrolysing)